MNILTFDIEEWYTYRHKEPGGEGRYIPVLDNYLDMLLDKLDERGAGATFFCLGAIARQYPRVIRRIAERGHRIGCHSDTHLRPGEMTPGQFAADTARALDSLRQAVGCQITSYRAPSFSIGRKELWAFDILADCGITEDGSIFPAARRVGGFPEFGQQGPCIVSTGCTAIREFPVSTFAAAGKSFARCGGGYFRLLPYPMVERLLKGRSYTMTYFHLRDFDTQQKKIVSTRFMQSYWGLSRTWGKICRLLDDFEFVGVEQAAASIDWEAVPEVKYEAHV